MVAKVSLRLIEVVSSIIYLSLKNDPVDVKVELQSNDNFSANTVISCLILHDRVVEYNQMSEDIRVGVTL